MFASTETSQHAVSFSQAGPPAVALMRFLGCALALRMPEEGLSETIEALQDLWEFHEEDIYHLPAPRVVQQGSGTVVSVSKRPDLVIAE